MDIETKLLLYNLKQYLDQNSNKKIHHFLRNQHLIAPFDVKRDIYKDEGEN